MSEAMREAIDAFKVLAEMVRKAQESLQSAYAPAPQPEPVEQPDRFEHRDIDGDRVLVYPHNYPEFQSVLMVETDGDSVRLSQDAVNGLAQYLDRYRTDQPKAVTAPSSDDGVTYPLPTGFDRCAGMYQGFRCRRLVDHEGGHA